MYSANVCLLFVKGGNIHYYIKVTISKDWRVVTLLGVGGHSPQHVPTKTLIEIAFPHKTNNCGKLLPIAQLLALV